MANAHRGEIAVELGGRAVTLRPTFEALARIEGETGVGVYALARRLQAALTDQSGELRAGDVASVLSAGIAAAEGRTPAKAEIGALIVEAGLIAAASAAFAFLIRALAGERDRAETDEG